MLHSPFVKYGLIILVLVFVDFLVKRAEANSKQTVKKFKSSKRKSFGKNTVKQPNMTWPFISTILCILCVGILMYFGL